MSIYHFVLGGHLKYWPCQGWSQCLALKQRVEWFANEHRKVSIDHSTSRVRNLSLYHPWHHWLDGGDQGIEVPDLG